MRGLAFTGLGMHSVGASAPSADLMRKFGFVPDKIVAAAKAQNARNARQ